MAHNKWHQSKLRARLPKVHVMGMVADGHVSGLPVQSADFDFKRGIRISVPPLPLNISHHPIRRPPTAPPPPRQLCIICLSYSRRLYATSDGLLYRPSALYTLVICPCKTLCRLRPIATRQSGYPPAGPYTASGEGRIWISNS